MTKLPNAVVFSSNINAFTNNFDKINYVIENHKFMAVCSRIDAAAWYVFLVGKLQSTNGVSISTFFSEIFTSLQ